MTGSCVPLQRVIRLVRIGLHAWSCYHGGSPKDEPGRLASCVVQRETQGGGGQDLQWRPQGEAGGLGVGQRGSSPHSRRRGGGIPAALSCPDQPTGWESQGLLGDTVQEINVAIIKATTNQFHVIPKEKHVRSEYGQLWSPCPGSSSCSCKSVPRRCTCSAQAGSAQQPPAAGDPAHRWRAASAAGRERGLAGGCCWAMCKRRCSTCSSCPCCRTVIAGRTHMKQGARRCWLR